MWWIEIQQVRKWAHPAGGAPSLEVMAISEHARKDSWGPHPSFPVPSGQTPQRFPVTYVHYINTKRQWDRICIVSSLAKVLYLKDALGASDVRRQLESQLVRGRRQILQTKPGAAAFTAADQFQRRDSIFKIKILILKKVIVIFRAVD